VSMNSATRQPLISSQAAERHSLDIPWPSLLNFPEFVVFSNHINILLIHFRIWEAQKERWHILVRVGHNQRQLDTNETRY
jgi:hypothetical protein